MSQFPIDQEKIFAATNGGLDILLEIYPFANEKKHFQLRKADKTNADLIIIQGVSTDGLGLAIMNRLLRACNFNIIR